MLSALSVRNIVLIDQLELTLDKGLTVLTGETGAGKSILLDALTLALGGRGDASLVRTGAESGQVVAVFQLTHDHPARAALRENDVADDAEIILRRVQFADGRTRAFVNDQPVSAGLLQTVGSLVVEIHGQHDDRALVDVGTHRALLDAFGGHEKSLATVRTTHARLVEADTAVEAKRAAIAEAAANEDYARHVVEELSALAPAADEEDALAERRQHLMQLEKSADDVNEADELLNGSTAPGPALSQLLRRLMRKVDGGATLFQPLVDSLDGALTALDHTSETLEALKREMAFDPRELEKVEERLFGLRGAARKHQVMVAGLPEVLARYQLRKAVEKELPDLKLGAAKFIVDQQVDAARISASGFDQIAFHVQTNPGTTAGPLLKVASGGELSRFLLALKVVLADRGSAPVLIFDEVDTGVGGAVSDAIGRRLGKLASKVQVLTVTHAPQVAARAQSHLLIEKQSVKEGAFMRTHVRMLDEPARREEVARMLAGAKVTEEARAAASRLISEVQ
jgi:DNA repair protein RecN (Recombination protein N)